MISSSSSVFHILYKTFETLVFKLPVFPDINRMVVGLYPACSNKKYITPYRLYKSMGPARFLSSNISNARRKISQQSSPRTSQTRFWVFIWNFSLLKSCKNRNLSPIFCQPASTYTVFSSAFSARSETKFLIKLSDPFSIVIPRTLRIKPTISLLTLWSSSQQHLNSEAETTLISH